MQIETIFKENYSKIKKNPNVRRTKGKETKKRDIPFSKSCTSSLKKSLSFHQSKKANAVRKAMKKQVSVHGWLKRKDLGVGH